MAVAEDQRLARRGSEETQVYVYGVVRPGAKVSAATGVLGAAVEVMPAGKIAALVSRVGGQVRAKRRDLLAHSDVLQDAFNHGVVLPLRFGTLFRSDGDVEDELTGARGDEILALLERFDGLGEMRLRVGYHDEEHVLRHVVAADPAILRLREETQGARPGDPRLIRLGELVASRIAERRAADESAILDRLGAAAVEVHRDEPDDDLVITKSSFLIRKDERSRFDELLDSLALGGRHLMQFICTGPMPPHSFVALSGMGGV
jgi:hypothetical protein